MGKGKFVTVEGMDGCGKTTMMDVAYNHLNESGIETVVTKEPGGTSFGQEVRRLLLQTDTEICDEAELLLIFAARAQHIKEVIEPALEKGFWVLCDRFTDSTFAYQGAGRQMGLEKVEALDRLVTNCLRPDLTLYLDVDVETGNTRSAKTGQNKDRFEVQENSFKNRVRQHYVQLSVDEPERVKTINSMLTLDEVSLQIVEFLDLFLDEI